MGAALEELQRPQSTAVPFYEQYVGTYMGWVGLWDIQIFSLIGFIRPLVLILKILHDLSILQYHYSQGRSYLGSCRIFRIHRIYWVIPPPSNCP